MVFGRKKKEAEYKKVEAEDAPEDLPEGELVEQPVEPSSGYYDTPANELPPLPPRQQPRRMRMPMKKVGPLWEVKNIPTQSMQVLYNSQTREQYDIYEALALILNAMEEG